MNELFRRARVVYAEHIARADVRLTDAQKAELIAATDTLMPTAMEAMIQRPPVFTTIAPRPVER
jgi:hypothetical protein